MIVKPKYKLQTIITLFYYSFTDIDMDLHWNLCPSQPKNCMHENLDIVSIKILCASAIIINIFNSCCQLSWPLLSHSCSEVLLYKWNTSLWHEFFYEKIVIDKIFKCIKRDKRIKFKFYIFLSTAHLSTRHWC